jgi:imidazolonepropionase-like amidohydrolase
MRRPLLSTAPIAAIAAALATSPACAPEETAPPASPTHAGSPSASSPPPADPFAADETKLRTILEPTSAPPAANVVLTHATILTATGQRFDPGFVALANGRIVAVGAGDPPAASVPQGAQTIDARGKFVTPGIIDPHSHMGVGPVPATEGHDDTNEMTDPVTAGVRAEDSFWPQDPSIERAVEGGVTTIAVLPGSANLIGGRGVVLHLIPQRGARAMRFPGAPEILKMACGENPKRVYKDQKHAPTTRMANLRAMREAFLKAQKYAREWDEYERAVAKGEVPDGGAGGGGDGGGEHKPPDRDPGLETLALVLRGDILVQWHCYQADDMLSALQLADEMGFKVRAFHHALEAYKIRDVLAAKHVAAVTWDDWWGFKMEAYDGIPENLALVHEAGARAVVHSDSEIAIQMLNQSAGKALAAGRAAGVSITEDDAIKWLTVNPAWALGVDGEVGTIEPGKRGDVVVWSEDPFSTYAKAERVYVDGRLVFDRAKPHAPWSDFELGVRHAPAPVSSSDGGAP